MTCKRIYIILLRMTAVLFLTLALVRPVFSDNKDKESSRFNGNIGFRLGLSMNSTDMPSVVDPEVTWSLESPWIQLYYYGKWFEVDLVWLPPLSRLWQSFEDVYTYNSYNIMGSPEDVSGYSRVAVTGYPFMVFDLNLGMTLGHLHHQVQWLKTDNPASSGDKEFSRYQYQSLLLGVTWRFRDRFRIALDLTIPYKLGFTYRDVFNGIRHIVYERRKIIPGVSFTFTAFIIKNLSLEAGYQLFVYDMKEDTNFTGTVNSHFGTRIRFYSHRITFAVGYGFNLK